MRLHRLRVTAFQAFADTAEVDFDALADAGLFLLHGDTGAGKTTLLDAVVFALYGHVPGPRDGVGRLRSDHAAPGVLTQVELELTLRGRRLQVVRLPEQERPKQRGEGMTRQPHAVRLSEWVDGGWQSLGTRHEEVAHALDPLLGMTREQFCQVVLLPQGDFARFLRASSDEREVLLGKLFSTERFVAAEEWLRRRKDEARTAAFEAMQEVRGVVAALAERAESPAPADWEHDVDGARAWSQGLAVPAAAQVVTAQDACTSSGAEARAASERLGAARDLAGRQAQVRALREEVRTWHASAPDRELRASELALAERAASLSPLLAEVDSALERCPADLRDRARAEAAAAGAGGCAGPGPGPGPGRSAAAGPAARSGPGSASASAAAAAARSLFDLLDEDDAVPVADAAGGADAAAVLRQEASARRGEVGRVSALAPVEARLAAAAEDLAGLDEEVRLQSARVAQADRHLVDAPTRRAELEAVLVEAREAAARLPGLAEAVGAAEARRDAGRRRDGARRESTELGASVIQLEAAAHDRKSAWLGIWEQRLAGMAGHLAAQLADGEPCLVCGATEHPAPAVPETGAPDEAAEATARLASDEAESHLLSARERLAEARRQHGAAAAVAGDEPQAELVAALGRATTSLAAAQALASGVPAAEAALEAHDVRVLEARGVRDAAASAASAADAEARTRRAACAEDETALRAALAGAPDIASRVAAIEEEARGLEAAAELASALVRATSAAVDAEFDDLVAARRAHRPADWREQRAAALAAEQRALAELEGRLGDPALRAAAVEPVPDLAALAEAAESAAGAARTAERDVAVAGARAEALARLDADLDVALRAHAPLAARHRELRELSDLVNGDGANRLRMRLTAFVLASRLEQVAQNASARLERMTEGRYTLQHCDERTGRERRAGLGLRVVDAWTGQERPPATLSGGESFLASLSLALGLADVVTAECGGAQLETLFVDEGFGTLDERTLEEVLTALDGLRTGGRVVGVVSHVAELRDRIPARVHVHKGRDGSRVEQTA